MLIVIWQLPIQSVPDGTAGMLRLLAAQAAVAIEHAGLRARMETLTLTDELTGVATRRVFEDELPRELARARRSEYPVAIALLDLDHLGAFNMLRGEREGDRLIKETAALWRNELREVDTLGAARGRLVRRDPAQLRAGRGDRGARPRARDHAARRDRVGGRRALGRRGALRAAASAARTRWPRPSRRAQRDARRRLARRCACLAAD